MSDLVFGPLVIGDEVEDAVVDTLKLWMPEYIPWLERKTGRDPQSLPLPRSYVTAKDFEHWPEEQLPSVLVINTGLADEPVPDGEGKFRAAFAVGLAVIASARDRAETEKLAQLYTAACRAILLAKPSLGGFAQSVHWIDEEYDPLPDPKKRRQLAAGQAVFRVGVEDVSITGQGPAAVRPNPYAPYPDDPTVKDDGASVVIETKE